MLVRTLSVRSLIGLARVVALVAMLIQVAARPVAGQTRDPTLIPPIPTEEKSLTVSGVVDGKEVRTCMLVKMIKNPAADYQPGSDIENLYTAAEDKEYSPQYWTRKEGPRQSHDCAGHIMIQNWKTGKYKVGANNFFENVVKKFGWKRPIWESYQPGDVVAWIGPQGHAYHVALVLNSTSVARQVTISSKDNERSTLEGPLYYSRPLDYHPLNDAAYPGFNIEIWHVRHVRFEETDCAKPTGDGKYVLENGPLVDPMKSSKIVQRDAPARGYAEWRVAAGRFTYHSESQNPPSTQDVSVEFVYGVPAELRVGDRITVGVRGRVAFTFEGAPVALNDGIYPYGDIASGFLSFASGGGTAARGTPLRVTKVGEALTFDWSSEYEILGGKNPLVVSVFVMGHQSGTVEVLRWKYAWVANGVTSSVTPSQLDPPVRDSAGAPPNVPPVVVVDVKPPIATGSFPARLVAKHSGDCVDVAGGDQSGLANGAVAHQWECLDVRSQEWKFATTDGNWYQIRTGHSQKCLDINQQATGNNTRLHQWECHAGDSQLWAMTQREPGMYSLVSKLANRCIDIASASPINGAAVQLFDCHYGQNQLFSLSRPTVTPDKATTPLKLFYSSARGDNFTTATTEGEQSALAAGYAFVRVEGNVFPTQQPGTVPLKLYYSAVRGDNYTTATQQGEQAALSAGYSYVRVEGYVYPTQQSGTVPLRNYWHAGRADNFTLTTVESDRDALGSGYQFAWIDGYLPALGGPAPVSAGVGGLWRYRLTCGTTEFEGVVALAPDAGGTFGGKGDGPWEPGTVTLSAGSMQGNQIRGLKFLPDAWVEPYVWNGQHANDGGNERVDGEAQRSSGACRFFMDRNAGPTPGFEPAGDWHYSSTCSPRTATGTLKVTRGANGIYTGRLNGPWEGVPAGDIWDGRVFGREVKFNFRPDGWNEHYFWKGVFADGRIDGQVFWRGQAACNFSMRR